MIFDTHAHYDSIGFSADRDQVLSALPAAGVGLVVDPGCDVPSSRAAVALAERYPHVYAAVGIHPEDCAGCTAGDFDLLITGDMSTATERLLLERYDLPDTEVLVAGHHGSKYSTSNALLEALTPETAIISVGSNSYGHPADETLRRLAESGAAICRTDKQGTIHLTVN